MTMKSVITFIIVAAIVFTASAFMATRLSDDVHSSCLGTLSLLRDCQSYTKYK